MATMLAPCFRVSLVLPISKLCVPYHKAKVVSRDHPDIDEPVIFCRVLGSDTIQYTAKDSNNEREEERQDAVLRLMDAIVALGTPLDQSV